MSNPRFDTAAVVLGMHRSGTSALAGVLRLKGYAGPRTVLPSSAANEHGFWESQRINALNDELLAELGTTWHGLNAVSFDGISKRRLRAVRSCAEAILVEEFKQGTRPLIKDPRLCRLLPLWKPALARSCLGTVFALTLRNPVEVAHSLAKRNEFDLEQGYLLWARYYLDAELHTRGLPRVIVTYDKLITDWRASLQAISTLGVDLDVGSAADSAVEEYLSAELRHHRTADEQVFLDLDHIPLVRQTYRALLDWARAEPGATPGPEIFDRARASLDDLGRIVSPMVENARLRRKRLGTAKSQIDAMAAELASARLASDDLAHVRASLESQSAAQARVEERLDLVAKSLMQAIEERASLQQLLAQARNDADEQRSRLEQALDATDKVRDALESEVDQLQHRADVAAEEHSRDRARLVERSDELRSELKDVKRKYRSTQHQLSRDREKLRKTQERLAEAETSLARIQQTAAWRGYHGMVVTVEWGRGLFRRALWKGGRKLRIQRAALIRTSPLFDRDWYLARYPDIAAAGVDPAVHYLEDGWREGRDPGPAFSTTSYLNSNGDVARSGINPLLHFIEFGYSEGRSISELAPSPSMAANEEFGPANPCASFAVIQREPIRWKRAARLAEGDGDLLVVAGKSIGFVPTPSHREAFCGAFDRLANLSGISAATGSPKPRSDYPFTAGQLADAWYIGSCQLRTRWGLGEPLVVRAYQYDPAGVFSIVGEGLVASDLDFVDISLINPYFPVLFTLAEPDGALRRCETLAFPSLCRGGLHYAELLALQNEARMASSGAVDIVGTSEMLADRLLAILNGTSLAFAADINVDLRGADGTESLLQSDFQAWLSTVMRIGVAALHADQPKNRFDCLVSAVRPEPPVRGTGGGLILPADSVPAISALVAECRDEPSDSQVQLRLLIAGIDPAEPVIVVGFPPAPELAAHGPQDVPSMWPRLAGPGSMDAAGGPAIVAIRHPKRAAPTESELLVPVADAVLPIGQSSRSITWLVFAEDWNDQTLMQGLHALSLQTEPSLALIGEIQPSTASTARALFHDRVFIFPDILKALDSIETSLVGYLGAGVILHDPRTSHILSGLLQDPSVVSASCVLLSSERRGKGWHVAVADAGHFARIGGEDHSPVVACRHAQILWRSTYPTLRPPSDLWVARSSAATAWLQRAGPLRPKEGMQLCTSLITASYAGDRPQGPPHLRPPAAAPQQAIQSQELFG